MGSPSLLVTIMAYSRFITSLIGLCLLVGLSESASLSAFAQYACVTDVGSSGSRVRIYGWNDKTSNIPKDVTEISSFKEYPGYSTLLMASEKAIEDYVTTLLDYAVAAVPKHKHQETAFYFLATAGLRLLEANHAHKLMQSAHVILNDNRRNPF